MVANEVDFNICMAQLKALFFYTDNDLLDHQSDKDALERVQAVNLIIEELLHQVEDAHAQLVRDCLIKRG